MENEPLAAHVVSLGCPKNRVDTEKFLQNLNLALRLGASVEDCQLLLVNTCAFIEPATRESIRTLLDLSASKKAAAQKCVFVVMGCLPARYPLAELQKEFPEIDVWASGPEDAFAIHKISSLFARKPSSIQNIDFGKSGYAYVKIADGCNHQCSFCAIPHFKGIYVSNPLSVILEDVQKHLAKGVKEVILVAQDLLSWGQDLSEKHDFIRLLEQLLKLDKIVWLRLLYLYPSMLTESLLKFMADAPPALLPYFDVPFQHSEMDILAKMGRPFRQDPRQLVDKIRHFIPNAAIRTTLITGFPGESEKDFLNLCSFVEQSEFSHLGVFAYHAEEGTKAALMPDQIPMSLREERRKLLMEIQKPISAAWLDNFHGRNMVVLVDESDFQEWHGLYKGRVWFQAPEIDGLTYISGENLEIGQFYNADITDSSSYDLSALAVSDV